MAIDIEIIHELCNILVLVVKDSVVARLNRMLRTKFKFTAQSKADDIDRARAMTKFIQLKIELKQDQYNALNKDNDKDKGVITREYFQQVLIVLSTSNKFMLLESMLTTFQYCALIKDHNEKVRRAEQNARQAK